MGALRYDDLVFDEDFLSAQRGQEEPLRFTRNERALLAFFTQNANRLLTRTQILDAITYAGSDIADRNVDFLINRLRAKIGDNARTPRFIATRYGEGYLWIAKPVEDIDAFLVIGPCHGLGHAATAEMAGAVLGQLAQALDTLTGQKHGIVVKPDWMSGGNGTGSVSYSLDASLHADGQRLHGAFVLREGDKRHILQTFRAAFARDAHADEARNLAALVKDAIWAHRALPSSPHLAPTDTPLEVRLHDAARLLSRTPESWAKSAAQIESARAAAPDDPSLGIMRGLALYAALLQRPDLTPEDWIEIEAEIESLVLNSLPAIQDNPLLVLGAAKLLFFIQRGHFELANRLAEEAFEKSTAFAAAFGTRAQMRMCEGDFAEAHLLFDKAIELSEPGSEFLIYLMVMKLSAALAANERPMVDALCAELYAIDPMIIAKIGLFVVSAEADVLPADREALLASVGEARARQAILYLYNVTARHFHDLKHRENVMRGLLKHATRRYGEAIVPSVVLQGLGMIEA